MDPRITKQVTASQIKSSSRMSDTDTGGLSTPASLQLPIKMEIIALGPGPMVMGSSRMSDTHTGGLSTPASLQLPIKMEIIALGLGPMAMGSSRMSDTIIRAAAAESRGNIQGQYPRLISSAST